MVKLSFLPLLSLSLSAVVLLLDDDGVRSIASHALPNENNREKNDQFETRPRTASVILFSFLFTPSFVFPFTCDDEPNLRRI